MKKIHLVHIIPDNMHIFHGYDEIIETIQWGLVQLGFTVSHSVERFEQNCTNIIFGAQMLSLEDLKSLPANTIIYNLEQMAALKPEEIREKDPEARAGRQLHLLHAVEAGPWHIRHLRDSRSQEQDPGRG